MQAYRQRKHHAQGRRLATGLAVLTLLLSACNQQRSGQLPSLQGEPMPASTAPAISIQPEPPSHGFALVSIDSRAKQQRSSINLQFNHELLNSQAFDQSLTVTDAKGAVVNGSWILLDDGRTLSFPYVAPHQHYHLKIQAGLLATNGKHLPASLERDVDTGDLPPALGFASSGSVLPLHGSRGLPVISVNAHDADIEFFRVHDNALSDLFCAYPGNQHRYAYDLDHPVDNYNRCADHSRLRRPITELADSVYANHYTLGGELNQRQTSYIPVQKISQLQQPGVYMAVLKRGGSFDDGYDSAIYYVTDIGIHMRNYNDSVLVHLASLRDGSAIENASLEIDDANGTARVKAVTDQDGNALIRYHLNTADVLIARHGKDSSVLPFNRPALDVSNFDVDGRQERALEIYPWSGRDLYRPGEKIQVSALLRDHDGSMVKPQPLFVQLRQPDGHSLFNARLDPQDLNYFALSQNLPADAPTGLWHLEFRLDPASKQADQSFAFHVEEFLPERLRVDLASPQASLQPGQALSLGTDSSYLYGAPAAGNRFTAKLQVEPELHPLPALQDTFFGNPLVTINTASRDVVDTSLDARGHWSGSIALPETEHLATPARVTVTGSVFEHGGRAVTRSLSRVDWPAAALVGVRPQFDPRQGAPGQGRAGFEIVRVDAHGTLLAGAHLKVRLQREIRDFYWLENSNRPANAKPEVQLQPIAERDLQLPAGHPAQLDFPVEWGSYRLEVTDSDTGLTTVFPFFAGYSWDDQNIGKEPRPDKVKLALDKARYQAGDTMTVTVTPPHEGNGLLLVESDHLLYTRAIHATAGARFQIPVGKDWQRHDVYVQALVFRGGEASELTTPARALGIEHVNIDRNGRQIGLQLKAPALIRAGDPLDITVQASGLAGQKAYLTIHAADQGVLNISQYAVPDAWSWMFAKRAAGIDAYDLYGRIIDALDGSEANLRYGGDLSGDKLPHAGSLNPRVPIPDLFVGPVAFDGNGKASLHLQAPDFNGSLRLAALAYSADHFGSASSSLIVRAPLVVETSTPRVMAAGDQARLSIDLKNLSDADGQVSLEIKTSGPIHVAPATAPISLKKGASTTLSLPLTASAGAGIASIDLHGQLGSYQLKQHLEFKVRPAWPEQQKTVALAIGHGASASLDQPAGDDYIAGSSQARLSLSSLPPLPYGRALRSLLSYPLGCIEQTTSKGYAALYLDPATVGMLGLADFDQTTRRASIDNAMSRIAAFQASNGHFTFWGGDTEVVPFMTPYVVDFLLDARDAGFAVPTQVLQHALQSLSDDLLAGGHPNYGYEYHDHLRVADEAYSGFVLARVNRAPLGTLRTIFDNDRSKLVAPLPLVHLGIALKLMGDTRRGQQAIDEAFAWQRERPRYVGDYGSPLRDLATMVALVNSYGMDRPEYDAKLIAWARDVNAATAQGTWSYLSTQDEVAIARIVHVLGGGKAAHLAAHITIGDQREQVPGDRMMWTRSLTAAELSRGVRISADSDAIVFASLDVAGIPGTPPPADASQVEIKRSYYSLDGQPWGGSRVKEGDSLITELTVVAKTAMPDALLTDLVPGGLEVENLHLAGSESLHGVSIDGVDLDQAEASADVAHAEFRDDRYTAAVNLAPGRTVHVFYLVRAVTPGDYTVPPPLVEDMYRPAIRGVGSASPSRLTVVEP